MDMSFNMHNVNEIIVSHGIGEGGRVQKFIDNECLRRADKYTPKQTGELIRSGTRGTVIGSGRIIYLAPYARSNYYFNAGRGLQGTAGGGLRGRRWFKRMCDAHRMTILKGTAQIAGCGYNG